MPGPYTYSFLDVNAALSGPGGVINLAVGAGAAEEGISFEPTEERDHMQIGAGGEGMHSLLADRSGKITIRLLKNSPTNQQLQQMMNFQSASAATFGQNTVSLSMVTSGDSISAAQVAFAKQPSIVYDKIGPMIEWTFNAVSLNFNLGAGV